MSVRARIIALFAQRWERPSMDHSHLLVSSTPAPSCHPSPGRTIFIGLRGNVRQSQH